MCRFYYSVVFHIQFSNIFGVLFLSTLILVALLKWVVWDGRRHYGFTGGTSVTSLTGHYSS